MCLTIPKKAPPLPDSRPGTPLAPHFPLATAPSLPGLSAASQASVFTLRQSFTPPCEKTCGSQRRRLWQLPPKYHCPVVGVCFSVEELRPWVIKALALPGSSSDYELHVGAVSACATRTPLAETLQRKLEKRFAEQIRRFANAARREEVAALWREASAAGVDIPGALWAAWTHPACDAALEQTIFRDIHMIQHQVGNATRADLAAMKALRNENAELRRELENTRRALDSLRQTRGDEQQAHALSLSTLRNEIIADDARIERLHQENEQLRASLPDIKRQAILQRRLRDAEARTSVLTARVTQLEHELTITQRQVRPPEVAPCGDDCAGLAPDNTIEARPKNNLAGKCVLCVGGRTGSIDSYKEVVEQRGGRFLHHDGGLEDNLQRIDAALSAADLVICQAGCISHNAYWRVKEQCKRTGKKCVFVKTPGASSLGRLIDAVGQTPETNTPAASTSAI